MQNLFDMSKNFAVAKRLRLELKNEFEKVSGFEGVSITRASDGKLAFAIHVRDDLYDKVQIPMDFHGIPLLKQKSSEIHLQQG